jgi:hypothetical protein
MPGLADARVGNDERAVKPKVLGDLSYARDQAWAEEHARSRLEIERHHLK